MQPESHKNMTEPAIEGLGGRRYLAHFVGGEEPVVSELEGSSEILDRLGLQDTDELRLMQATAKFLLSRQLAVDLPPVIDLDDVVAGYDDYIELMRNELS